MRALRSLVLLLGTACTRWPLADCEESNERRAIRFGQDDITVEDTGEIVVASPRNRALIGAHIEPGRYPSCKELCQRQDGVISVESCTAPVLIAEPAQFHDDQRRQSWRIECNVLAAYCEVPEGPNGSRSN